ncbi:MAG: glycosyltransferase family 2 protein [Gloeomargaritaceae cyanobacterium C42_A2020_066]|nr:glycosyltransferase family 2 protein [Gloeomargaritaceae cyanobacterium C42_A2020_066]
MLKLSVIIPTYKPSRAALERVLWGLRTQNLPLDRWELVIVDNATPDVAWVPSFDYGWHPAGRVLREMRQGLTWARLAGILASQGEYLVFVDDDNLLEPDYLSTVIEAFDGRPQVGGLGGKVLPEFEQEPEPWMQEFWDCYALRDCGDTWLLYPDANNPPKTLDHPAFLPVGAGMALRRAALVTYIAELQRVDEGAILDRSGSALTSGGDCDINLTLLRAGWQLAYVPQLRLTHLIPAGRLNQAYLARLRHGISYSWPQVLAKHGINPWPAIPPWTVPLRRWKAFWTARAWSGPAAYVRWRGLCGKLEGQAALWGTP